MTLLRLIVAAVTPLSPDEAYYWVWSRALAPGYLDHPPMVALWIRAGTLLIGDNDLGIRLLAPLAAALGSLLLADTGRLLFDRRTGLIAALLMNATLFFGVGSVTMTPDTPELLFWTATLWSLARLLATGNPHWWFAAGAALGLALDSKYTAALLLPAIFLWLLTPAMRPWLRRPQPWLALVLAALLFLPVILWNAHHDWASFAKQAGRTDAWHPARALQFEAELVLGQLGLATPPIALLCAAGLAQALRRWRDPAWSLLATLTAIPALVFLQHAIGDRVQANWPSVIYPTATLAAARLPQSWQRLTRPGIALGLALTALVWLQAATGLIPAPMLADPTLLRLGGWDGLAATIATHPAAYLAAENYGQAALLARLLPTTEVLGVESRWSLFALPDGRPDVAGKPGLLLRSARREGGPDPADWSDIEEIATIDRSRQGMTAETFRLYHVVGRPTGQPIAVMPRIQ